jgi:hypothetical protein
MAAQELHRLFQDHLFIILAAAVAVALQEQFLQLHQAEQVDQVLVAMVQQHILVVPQEFKQPQELQIVVVVEVVVL